VVDLFIQFCLEEPVLYFSCVCCLNAGAKDRGNFVIRYLSGIDCSRDHPKFHVVALEVDMLSNLTLKHEDPHLSILISFASHSDTTIPQLFQFRAQLLSSRHHSQNSDLLKSPLA